VSDIDWYTEITARAEPGLLDEFDADFIVTKAEDAVAFIADSVPAAARRLASGKLTVRTYTRVVCDMVLRILRNPAGHRSEGDGVYNYTSAATVASGDLWLPDKDKALLTGPVVSAVPGTIRLGVQRGWRP